MFPVWSHWNATLTRRGKIVWTLQRLLKTFTLLSSLLGLVYFVRNGREKTGELLRDAVARSRGLVRRGIQGFGERV
jgi:hypothetical protein